MSVERHPTGARRELPVVDLPEGVRLHYVERGAGTPVVFVHGGGKDLHYWDRQLGFFAERWRCVAYSRRYAPPNHNARVDDYNAVVDARDLEALLDRLDAAPAHLVGASVGAAAALFLAARRPELVRSLVIAEPPLLGWARETPEGEAAFQRFLAGFGPAGRAFGAGDDERGMTLLMDTFLGEGAFMRFPEPLRRRVMRGAADWSAQTTSTAAFPTLTHEMAASIRVPVLMLGGERTLDVHRLTDRALRRAIPHAERIVIPGATHDLWADEPVRSREAAMAFLERVGRDGEAVGDGR